MNPRLELRERLLAVLTGPLAPGTAILPGGQTTPAITVGDWPEGTTVTGLEVLIGSTPRQRAIDAFEFLGYVEVWTVRLVNWQNAVNLEDAANAVAAEFWPLDADPQVIPENSLVPEQVVLSVVLQD